MFTNGGYGCKPVIYAYDQRKRTNQLTISLPAGSRFTKLIPEFTSGTTWDFRTDEASRISVGNQTFPYLYYSTWRNQYENNPQGRTVAYEDLSAFFRAKLDAMNFNQQEKADFLDYWLPEFEPGFVYTISFKINEDFEPYAQLSFLHQPEKIFRVFMEAHQHPLTKHVSFDPSYPNAGNEKFLKVFERGSSFDVLERGGKLEKWRAK